MKIDAKTLLEFVNKVTIGNNIQSFVLEATQDGLVCRLKTTDNIGASSGLLKRNIFTIPPQPGLILGFNDSRKIAQALKTFSGEVSIELKDNLIVFSNQNKVVNIVKSSPEFIENYLAEELSHFTKFDGGFNIQTQHLRNVKANKEIANSDEVLFEVKNKELRLAVGQAGFDNVEDVIVGIDYRDCSGKYPELFEVVVAQCGNLINVATMNDHPINGPLKIAEQTEKMWVKWLIAPRILEEQAIDETAPQSEAQ